MEPESTFTSTVSSPSGDNNSNKVLIAISVVLLIVIFSGISYWLGGRRAIQEAQVLNTQTVAPVATPQEAPALPSTPISTPTTLPTVSPSPNSTISGTPTAFRVTSATAEVSPTINRDCPQTFVFTGTITANAAGTATYTWERSDKAPSATETVVFAAPGAKTVKKEWPLGGGVPAGYNYNGWQQLKIISPNSLSSNQAAFTLACP